MRTIADFVEAIDRATEPKQMTLREAIDFCERLVTEIESKIEGMKEDLGERL
jgi:hypothetical protein